jgi:hypothetical protein
MTTFARNFESIVIPFMKRLVILLFAVMTTAAIWAQAFTEDAKAYVNGSLVDSSPLSITVTKNGSLYNVTFNATYVGNVELKDVKSEAQGSSVILMANQDVAITSATDPQPVKMVAAINGSKMTARLTVDMSASTGQLVDIYLGDGILKGTNYQVPNGDFESWHSVQVETKDGSFITCVEPNRWHSYGSAKITNSSVARAFAQLTPAELVTSSSGRNGNCARLITAVRSFMGNRILNGTMTTGRLNCGSLTASDKTKNYTFLDMSSTERDSNNDPYYITLTHKPDSLSLWIQFTQGGYDFDPYCVVSGTITDGTFYQEPPLDAQKSHVVCNARNANIVPTGKRWKRISIPFDYASYPYGAECKAIMITISSSATTGEGNDGDELLVDDLSLVYNCQLRQLGGVTGFSPDKYDYEVSTDIDATSLVAVGNGQETHVLKTEKPAADGKYIYVDVYSGDLKSRNTYTIHCKTGTGIAVTTKTEKPGVETYYNIGGQRISAPRHGQVTIVKTTDGRTFKTVVK